MTPPREIECYCCQNRGQPQGMAKLIARWCSEQMRLSAIALRRSNRKPDQAITEADRICAGCRNSLPAMNENQSDDPVLDVLLHSGHRACIICQNTDRIIRVPFDARVDVFQRRNIFVPSGSRICQIHLTDDKKRISLPLLRGLQFASRRIHLSGHEIAKWMKKLGSALRDEKLTRFHHLENFSDDEFYSFTGITKHNFLDLHELCKTVILYGRARKITRRDLMLFLTKLRHGLSDDFLRTLFGLNTRSAATLITSKVRKSLMTYFVPLHLGLGHITRRDYINNHVTDFANMLYNNMPQNKQAIIVIDGTYLRIPKSFNHRVLRQSFCKYKNYHLVKPILLVSPTGYILDVHGPYFSDSRNNDAQCLLDQLRIDVGGLRQWLRNEDIFLVDRGYRDSIQALEQIGIVTFSTGFDIPAGQTQGIWEEVNSSRLVTVSRWIVEARNGHIKSLFKFFNTMIPAAHLPNIGDFFRIACALINAFHPEILMQDATVEKAQQMLLAARNQNSLEQRVINEELTRRNRVQWLVMDQHVLPRFPMIPLEYLRDITFGTYQIKLSPGYTMDKYRREGNFVCELRQVEPGLLRARVYSKHSNRKKYNVFVKYRESGADPLTQLPLPVLPQNRPILAWYCTCKTGTRTLGMCCHCACVIWYLGFARHNAAQNYPSETGIHAIMDAEHREIPDVVNFARNFDLW